MKRILLIIFTLFQLPLFAQKITSIHFNLYTDSLKKGVQNYINIDGKLSNGRYTPLDTKRVTLNCNTGKWEGNNLIIDSAYNKDSVVVEAILKEDISIKETVTIYLKKNLAETVLKTEAEILESMKKKKAKGKK